MTLLELINEVATNAPVDRAGAWLMVAADDYPELFSAITSNLDADPAQVIQDLAKHYPAAIVLVFMPTARGWIENLQMFFKAQYAKGEKPHGKT